MKKPSDNDSCSGAQTMVVDHYTIIELSDGVFKCFAHSKAGPWWRRKWTKTLVSESRDYSLVREAMQEHAASTIPVGVVKSQEFDKHGRMIIYI